MNDENKVALEALAQDIACAVEAICREKIRATGTKLTPNQQERLRAAKRQTAVMIVRALEFSMRTGKTPIDDAGNSTDKLPWEE